MAEVCVLNNCKVEIFSCTNLDKKSAQKIQDVFLQMDYQCEVLSEQLTKKEFTDKLKNITNDENLKNYDGIIIYILSHGDEETIEFNDGNVKCDDVIKQFSNANCNSLIGKPKIIFFNTKKGKNISLNCNDLIDSNLESTEWNYTDSSSSSKVLVPSFSQSGFHCDNLNFSQKSFHFTRPSSLNLMKEVKNLTKSYGKMTADNKEYSELRVLQYILQGNHEMTCLNNQIIFVSDNYSNTKKSIELQNNLIDSFITSFKINCVIRNQNMDILNDEVCCSSFVFFIKLVCIYFKQINGSDFCVKVIYKDFNCLKKITFGEIKFENSDKIIHKMLTNYHNLKGITFEQDPFRELIINENEIQLKVLVNETFKSKAILFDDLKIQNCNIDTLESNTFKNVAFSRITITKQAKLLKHIEFDAFGIGSKYVKRLRIENDLPAHESQENLIMLLNSFVNVEEINITSSRSLKGILNLPELLFLVIRGSNSDVKLEQIDQLNIFNCNKLIHINLGNNNLRKIPLKLLESLNNSDEILTLDLSNNNLNNSSLEKSSFLNLKRPVKLVLNQNAIDHLEKTIFQPFLNLDMKNKIYLCENKNFDINNNGNKWLLEDKYKKQVFGIKKKL